MAVLSHNDIARAIYLMSKGKSDAEQSGISSKVVKFLSRRRLLSQAPHILTQLSKIMNQEEGRIVAKVSSVEVLNSQTKVSLEQSLKKRYGAKEVVLKESLDPKLLGGIRVEVNSEVIDLSMKNRIEKLQEYLKKSI